MSKVSIKNISSFPTIQASKSNVKYVAHYGEILKLIIIKTQEFPNHIVSISTDNRLKLWNLKTNECEKTLNLEFLTKDLIQINENFIIVCGEKIVKIDLYPKNFLLLFNQKSDILLNLIKLLY